MEAKSEVFKSSLSRRIVSSVTASPLSFFRSGVWAAQTRSTSAASGRDWFHNQFVKQSAVVNQRFPHIFGASLPARSPYSGLVRLAIMFDDQRVIHGELRRLIFEIG